MLINVNKYRGAAVPSEPPPPLLLRRRGEGGREKKEDVQLHLPAHEVRGDTDICQKARYAPVKLAAATVLATAISRGGVVLMPA